MGFFSWQTCDKEQSVMNSLTDECKTVYLLQPNGKPALYEPAYDGYGVFGGVDAYQWLMETNADHLGIDLNGLDDEARRITGINLAIGSVCKDSQTGEFWSYADKNNRIELLIGSLENSPVVNTFESWGSMIEQYNTTVNDLINSGRFERIEINTLLEVRYPIKLSFYKHTDYNDYPASKDCPRQGFFE